jgi:2-polyprenyl-6-methoxyphenol hydroxylase-like FAD-dependent oxidoreductase
VVDKATFPRDKCCGDGLTTNALRILDQLGFDPSRVPDWQVTSDVLVHSPTGRTIELALPNVGGIFAAIAPRSQFDHALVQHCRDAGITIQEGHAFVSLSETDTSVVVEVEGLEPFTVDYVVAADGMWSPVRKAMGLSTAGYLGEWHAFRQYIGNVTGSSATQ